MKVASLFFAFMAFFHVQLMNAQTTTLPNAVNDAFSFDAVTKTILDKMVAITKATRAQDALTVFNIASSTLPDFLKLTDLLDSLGADALTIASQSGSQELFDAIKFADDQSTPYNTVAVFFANEIIYNSCNTDVVLDAVGRITLFIKSLQAQFATVKATAVTPINPNN